MERPWKGHGKRLVQHPSSDRAPRLYPKALATSRSDIKKKEPQPETTPYQYKPAFPRDCWGHIQSGKTLQLLSVTLQNSVVVETGGSPEFNLQHRCRLCHCHLALIASAVFCSAVYLTLYGINTGWSLASDLLYEGRNISPQAILILLREGYL